MRSYQKLKNVNFTLLVEKMILKLINEFKKSEIGKNCQSFEKLTIKETLPIIKNCDCYIGSDTGFAHLSVALGVKALTLFMDSQLWLMENILKECL